MAYIVPYAQSFLNIFSFLFFFPLFLLSLLSLSIISITVCVCGVVVCVCVKKTNIREHTWIHAYVQWCIRMQGWLFRLVADTGVSWLMIPWRMPLFVASLRRHWTKRILVANWSEFGNHLLTMGQLSASNLAVNPSNPSNPSNPPINQSVNFDNNGNGQPKHSCLQSNNS